MKITITKTKTDLFVIDADNDLNMLYAKEMIIRGDEPMSLIINGKINGNGYSIMKYSGKTTYKEDDKHNSNKESNEENSKDLQTD